MHAKNFDLQSYFTRIGYKGLANPDLSTLRSLMRKQLFSIPFENIDIQMGKVVSLTPENIVYKILNQNRGGYCYEVNGLFCMALQAIGIPYQFIAARPMFYPSRRPRTHMALIAKVDDKNWLCDLGFGSYGIREPIDLAELGIDIQQGSDTFRLSCNSRGEYTLIASVNNEWKNQYSFDLSPQEWVDFELANYMNSTHPETVFVSQLLVILHNETGRIILSEDNLKIISGAIIQQSQLSLQEIPEVLHDIFGLSVPGFNRMIQP